LPCWHGVPRLEPLGGGISNVNFVAEDDVGRFVVRIGEDVPVHGVVREFERTASRAAHAAGLSPEVVHAQPGALVFRYVEGRTLTPAEVRDRAMLERILPLVRRCHRDMPRHVRGPTRVFWPLHAVREYARRLREDGSRVTRELPTLMAMADRIEAVVAHEPMVFAHNDLLAANLIDDGERLWLIDWEYGGFNAPLFDLANLASNNELFVMDERWLIESYFQGDLGGGLERRYAAMRCLSLLREAMWSMVSEIHSELDFDYRAYTEENLARCARAHAALVEGAGE
jgi:thiamine kinase-like enzyme